MLKFKFSSPGKIILFGEHAVVYGYAAVATAISKRMTMTGEMNKSTIGSEINIVDDNEFLSFNPHEKVPANAANREKMIRHAFSNFPKNHSLELKIKSGFPVGNGLGSSASFCSLIAAASSKCADELISKETMYNKSKELENFFHNNPSGLDPATVIYGGAIKMENKQITKASLPNIPLLIIDTYAPRSTAKAVKHVADLCQANPKIYKPMLEILGQLSLKFCNSNMKAEIIPQLFPIAQNLLASFDLSCKEIDEIVQIAKANSLVAKISGGGMGGTVLVSGPNVHRMADKFSKYGVIQAEIGAEGMREE